MAIKQIPSTPAEREMWGRCLRGYVGAIGTGGITDPECNDVGLSGQLDFNIPIDEWEIRGIWEVYGTNQTHPESLWHSLTSYKYFKLDMTGYKFGRGFFKGDAWAAPLRLFVSNHEFGLDKQAGLGFLAARNPIGLFALLDKWRAGKYPASLDLEEAVRRA